VTPHILPVLHHQDRAQRNLQARADGSIPLRRRPDDDLTLVGGDDVLSLRIGHVYQPVAVLDRTGNLRLASGLLSDSSSGTTDVEGTQGKLRARLTDRLSGDDADRLAKIDHGHGRQVP